MGALEFLGDHKGRPYNTILLDAINRVSTWADTQVRPLICQIYWADTQVRPYIL